MKFKAIVKTQRMKIMNTQWSSSEPPPKEQKLIKPIPNEPCANQWIPQPDFFHDGENKKPTVVPDSRLSYISATGVFQPFLLRGK
jgi:hypothetical protein